MDISTILSRRLHVPESRVPIFAACTHVQQKLTRCCHALKRGVMSQVEKLEQHCNSTFAMTRAFKLFDRDMSSTIDSEEMRQVRPLDLWLLSGASKTRSNANPTNFDSEPLLNCTVEWPFDGMQLKVQR